MLLKKCDNSNPHYDSAGYFGYTEKFGNHPGGQAEYLKVPLCQYYIIRSSIMNKIQEKSSHIK
jgi:threonine dehydrogenase-like Zn-dependent dehydrogenase